MIGKTNATNSGGSSTPALSETEYLVNGSFQTTDSYGITHTMVPTYTDDILTAVTYDGVQVDITYDANGNLKKVGGVNVSGTGRYTITE